MSAKAISEAKGKELLNRHLKDEAAKNRVATVTENPNWDELLQNHPWLSTEVSISLNVILPIIFFFLSCLSYLALPRDSSLLKCPLLSQGHI